MSNSKVLHVICIHCVLSPSKDTDISLRPKCYNCQLTVVTRKQHHQSFVPRHLFTYTSHRFGPPACQSARPSICSALFVPARSSIRPSKPRPWRRQSHLFRPAAHRLPPVPAAPDRPSIHVSHALWPHIATVQLLYIDTHIYKAPEMYKAPEIVKWIGGAGTVTRRQKANGIDEILVAIWWLLWLLVSVSMICGVWGDLRWLAVSFSVICGVFFGGSRGWFAVFRPTLKKVV